LGQLCREPKEFGLGVSDLLDRVDTSGIRSIQEMSRRLNRQRSAVLCAELPLAKEPTLGMLRRSIENRAIANDPWFDSRE